MSSIWIGLLASSRHCCAPGWPASAFYVTYDERTGRLMTAIRAYLGIGGNLVPDGYDTLLSALQAAIHQINQIAL